MFDDKKLWKDRVGETSKEMGRYLRYIFNGHLIVVMFFLLGTVAFYYQGWVQTLTPEFPVAFVMMLTLVVFMTYSPTYTFLQRADTIFLLPVEPKMKNYFFRSHVVSIIFQAYVLLLLLMALMPMYVQVYGGGYGPFFLLFLYLLLFKTVNVFIRKSIYRYVESSVHQMDLFIRFIINGLGLYVIFTQAHFLFVLAIFASLLLMYVYVQSRVKEKGLKWDVLIQLEEKRMGSFYRLANLFTDVPQLKERVKQRKYVNFILPLVPFGVEQTYRYLFLRTFLRSGDYFGLVVRLTLIGSVGIYFIPSEIGQLILAIVFIYLTGFQLMPLRFHHENNLFTHLYPIEEAEIDKAFQRMLTSILVIQSTVFSVVIVTTGQLLYGIMTLAIAIIFSIGFVYLYSKRTFQKRA